MFHLLHEVRKDHKMLWYCAHREFLSTVIPGLQLPFSVLGTPILSTGPSLGTGKMWFPQRPVQLLRLETHLISTWSGTVLGTKYRSGGISEETSLTIQRVRFEVLNVQLCCQVCQTWHWPHRDLNRQTPAENLAGSASTSLTAPDTDLQEQKCSQMFRFPGRGSTLQHGSLSVHLPDFGKNRQRKWIHCHCLIRKLVLVVSIMFLKSFCTWLCWAGLVAHGPCDPQFLWLHSQGHKRPLTT